MLFLFDCNKTKHSNVTALLSDQLCRLPSPSMALYQCGVGLVSVAPTQIEASSTLST